MLTDRVIVTPSAPTPAGSYSQAKQVGRFMQVSGQLPIDPATGRILEGGIKEQTTQGLVQIEAILAQADAGWADVPITRVHLSTDQDFDTFDATYAHHVPRPYPARVTVGTELAPGALVEIDVLAVVPDHDPADATH